MARNSRYENGVELMSNYKGKFLDNQKNNPWNIAFDMIEKNSRVLDVGCSNGALGESLIKLKNCIVDGIEMDKGDFKKAKEVLNKTYNLSMEEFLRSASVDNDKYDVILFMDVIEHLYNPVEVLAKTKKLLNSNGMIIFSIPNMAHISTRLMLMAGEFEYGNTGLLDNTHLHFYTKKEIERIFAESGYSSIDFNRVEVAYTKDFLISELEKIGVEKISQKLLKELSSNSAAIFQYVGFAKFDNSSKLKLKIRDHYSPNPQGLFSDWYEERIEHLNYSLEQCRSEIQDLVKQKELINKQLSGILSSNKYKFILMCAKLNRALKNPRILINKAKSIIRK